MPFLGTQVQVRPVDGFSRMMALSAMVCHRREKTGYYQPAYQI